MRHFFKLTLLSFSAVNATIKFGYFRLFSIDHEPTQQKIEFVEDGARISSKSTVFDFDERGILQKFQTEKYLFINGLGQLVLDSKPHFGFQLAQELTATYSRQLSYKGSSEFQVCEDGSIGFQSDCFGALSASIVYKEFE